MPSTAAVTRYQHISVFTLNQYRHAVRGTRHVNTGVVAFHSAQLAKHHYLARKTICLPRPLSRRLNQVLQLIGHGYAEPEIAKRLGIGLGIVRTYLDQVKCRLPVSSREDLRRLAREWSEGKLRIYARSSASASSD